MIQKIKPELLEFSEEIQNLCKLKYSQHPHGCPNYGKRDTCPPNQPLINKVLDFSQSLYIIYTEFQVGKFAEKIGKKHPDWTQRQGYNLRYWQPIARKELREEAEKFLDKHEGTIINYCPEAYGVNLVALMLKLGIKLKWNYWKEHKLDNVTYRIALVGYPYNGN